MRHASGGGSYRHASAMRVRFLLFASISVVLTAILPAAIAGAKEGVGSFRVTCAPSHEGFFDPIVFPGQQPAGHQHEFYGSTSIGPSSGPGSLVGTSTTCSDRADASGYWHPTVFFDGVRAPATLASIYYTQRTTKKPVADVQAWPAGLRVIAGDMHAQGAQSDFIVWWDCEGAPLDRQPTAPTCPTSSLGLEVTVRFPDCWDGVNLDSADHKSHMSYSVSDGSGVFRCDAAHPVALPYLSMIVRWDGQYPAGESVTLSSGSAFAFHADFMNGWNQERLVALLDQCIKAQTECGRITSGTRATASVVTTSPAPPATTAVPASATTVTSHAGSHPPTTAVTSATTPITTAGHHPTTAPSGAPNAASPLTTQMESTTDADIRTAGASPTSTTIGSVAAANSLEPRPREAVVPTGSDSNTGGLVAVTGVVVLAAGLWALLSAGYSRLRRPPAPSND